MKCASPLVLLEFQCPTPQVTSPLSSCFLSPAYISQVLFPPLAVASLPALFLPLMNKGQEGGTSVLRGSGVSSDPTQPLPPAPPKICVEKCPSRYLTYLNAHASEDFEYYKQYCLPGFQKNKVSG